jgi:hypothetical protein
VTFESSRLVGAELYTSVHTCQLYAHMLCGRPSPPPALPRRWIDVVTLPTPRPLAHLLSIFRQRCSASWFNQDDGFLSSPRRRAITVLAKPRYHMRWPSAGTTPPRCCCCCGPLDCGMLKTSFKPGRTAVFVGLFRGRRRCLVFVYARSWHSGDGRRVSNQSPPRLSGSAYTQTPMSAPVTCTYEWRFVKEPMG